MKHLFATLLAAVAMFPALAHAGAEDGKVIAAEVCAACHGADGNSPAPMFPNLAGQNQRYIYLQLKDFKEGRRKNDLMSPLAANLTKQQMNDLGSWFASQKAKPTGFKPDGVKVVEGKKVADNALCPMCHLGGFSGQNEVPRVAGQHYDYVLKQLMDFKYKRRTNDAGNMQSVVRTISDEDLERLANYAASLD